MILAMDASRWQKVKLAFDVAVDADPDSRRDVLRSLEDSDPEVAQQVRSLLEADSRSHSFLEQPCINTSDTTSIDPVLIGTFRVGEVLAGRFQITRLLGTGGMGEVYEALDTELGGHVAIKTVRSEVSQNPAMLSQFRLEVNVARRITHRNICRTFDIERIQRTAADGSTQQVTCLTMEYLPGETLHQRLKRSGVLPPQQAIHIARQMAEALRAAHQANVVHRDIKPANVMLVPDGPAERAVITDFGLARFSLAAESQHAGLSRLGVVGTPAYMAPEQMRGATVSAATDIYSFGLVVLEMMTDTKARAESLTLTESQLQQLPALQAVPAHWRQALARCLRVNPEERFANAAELLAFVDQATAPLSGTNISGQQAAVGLTRMQWATRAAAMLLCIALGAAGFYFYYSSLKSRPVPEGASVLFAGIDNQTTDPALANVAELLRNQLSQTARFSLLDEDRIHDILASMRKPADTPVAGAVAREVAMRAGAVRVVHGSIRADAGAPNGYLLTISVEQPDNVPTHARNTWQHTYPWQGSATTQGLGQIPPSLLKAVRDSSDWVRDRVGESADDIARLNATPEDVTTGNWQALQEYTSAEKLYADHHREQAVQALRNAVAADPGFALAYGRMGDILLSMNQEVEGYRAYDAALASVDERRLTRRERDRIKGLYAMDTMDFESAERAFHDYSTYYDHDYLGWFYRAWPLVMLNRTDEALGVLQKAYDIDRSRIYAPTHLAIYNLIRKDHDATRRWIAELRRLNATDLADYNEGLLAFLENRPADAERFFELGTHSKDPQRVDYSLATLGRLYAELGEDQRALQVLHQAEHNAASLGDIGTQAWRLTDIAYLECRLQQYSACLDHARQARQLQTSSLLAIQLSRVLGVVVRQAPASFHPQVRRELELWKSAFPTDTHAISQQLATLLIESNLQLLDSKYQQAVETARKASEIDAPIQGRDYLGYALLEQSAHTTEPAIRENSQQEAKKLFAKIASSPEDVWHAPITQLPGSGKAYARHISNN